MKIEEQNLNEPQKSQLNIPAVSGSSFDWDKFANALKDEFGESLVEEKN